MALRGQKRSVSFHKGLADGTDRFLLEPPSIDYAENLTLGKDGSFSKRYGFELVDQIDNPTGEPLHLHAIGDRLFAFMADGVRTWAPGDGSWATIEGPQFFGTRETVCETLSQHGISQIQYTPVYVGGALHRHVVAYEIIGAGRFTPGTAGGGQAPVADTDVMIVYFDAGGDFLEQKRIAGAFSPRFSVSDDFAYAWLWYLKPDNTLDVPTARVYRRRNIAGAEVDEQTIYGTWYVGGYPLFNDPMQLDDGERLGQAENFSGKYVVGHDPVNNRMVLVNTFGAFGSVGSLNIYAFDAATGAYVDGGSVTAATEGGPTVFDLQCTFASAGTAAVHLVYAVWDYRGTHSPAYQWSLRYSRILLGAAGFSTLDTQLLQSGTANPATADGLTTAISYAHATICSTPDTQQVLIAATITGRSAYSTDTDEKSFETNMWNVRNQSVGVTTWIVDWAGTVLRTGFVRGHRVASKAVYDYARSRWLVAFQQWADYTPMIWDGSGTPSLQSEWSATNRFLALGPALKPVTTILCEVTSGPTSVLHRPIAALDQGQVADYCSSEVRTQLLDLYQNPDGSAEYWICNRVVVEAFDATFYVGAISSALTGRPERRVEMLLGANALGRIHQVKQGLDADSDIPVADFGDGLFLGTPLPLWFDANYAAELSPLDSPEIVSTNLVNGDADVEKYQRIEQAWNVAHDSEESWEKLQVVFGYTDTKGNIHRSAPSAPLYIRPYKSVSGQTGLSSVSEVYVTPPISALPASQNYWCEVYYAERAPDDPQLIAVESYPTDGNWQEISVPIAGGRYNQYLASNDPDYTTPRSTEPVYTVSDLAADPWINFGKAVATSTRLWTIDVNNPGRVVPSKLFEDYIAPEYNPTLGINLGDERLLTAIGKLDDKIVVFEPNDIHVIYGDGPDNRGEGQDFAVHYISTDVGCRDQKSVIETPVGLLFYSSPRGFYLLDRNLQVQFVGDPIEDLARGIRIKDATIDPANAEVRFLVEPDPNATQTVRLGPDPDTTKVTRPPRPVFGNELPDDACLVYFYETGDWMLYTNYPGVASTLYQGAYTQILSDASVWQESEGYLDPTGTNRTILRTPWIKLSDTIQDYQRLWRISFLGRYLSSLQNLTGRGPDDPRGVYEAGDITVRLYFDYESEPGYERVYPMQSFGFDVFDRPPKRAERLQFELEPPRGRTQAVKIEIEETETIDRGEGLSYALGAGFVIVAADLFVGVSPMRSLLPTRVR